MKRVLGALTAFALVAGTTAPSFAARHDRGGRYDRGGRHEQRHEWRRGDRFDRDTYRGARYVDWRRAHLPRPYRGCEWREVNGRYFEIVIATGIIAAIFGGR